MSVPEETFRGTMQGRTPDGAWATVIVTRKGWVAMGGLG